MTIFLHKCSPGMIINLFSKDNGNLAEWQEITNNIVIATYLGKYDNNYSSDHCLIGWLIKPLGITRVNSWAPDEFVRAPLVPNPNDFKFFRWCGADRIVHSVQKIHDTGTNKVSAVLKPGELSPNHVPGWHQCNCGFRNQDISETAFIAGKYVCHSCRYIWKK